MQHYWKYFTVHCHCQSEKYPKERFWGHFLYNPTKRKQDLKRHQHKHFVWVRPQLIWSMRRAWNPYLNMHLCSRSNRHLVSKYSLKHKEKIVHCSKIAVWDQFLKFNLVPIGQSFLIINVLVSQFFPKRCAMVCFCKQVSQ